MKLQILYRTTGAISHKELPDFASKELCAASLLAAYEECPLDAELHVINDGPQRSPALSVLEAAATDVWMEPRRGNSGSYRRVLEHAVTAFDIDDIVYFVEDDYLHTPSALTVLAAGVTVLHNIDYFTLYEHPNAYRRLPSGPTFLYLVEGTAWRTIPATCMTFAARVHTLRRDFKIHQARLAGPAPDDFGLFLRLQGRTVRPSRFLFRLADLGPPRLSRFPMTAARHVIGRHMERGHGSLAATCPSHACHLDLTHGLALGRDWKALAEDIRYPMTEQRQDR